MISPRWRKVMGDLWGNKTRTMLVVLSIAVGVMAVGMIAGTQEGLSTYLADDYLATNPASVILYTDPVDDATVRTIDNMREVQYAEGRRSMSVRVKVGPEEWKDLQLWAIADYDEINVSKVTSESGAWPPPHRGMLIERSSFDLLRTNIGDSILVETPDNRQRELQLAGLAHDLNQMPAMFTGRGVGYITLETLESLGAPRNFNQLNIVVAGDQMDREHISAVAEQVSHKIENSGRAVHYTYIPEPGKHPMDSSLQAFLVLLGVLGATSLLLSGFLVVNTVSALLTQQIRQIGIMKAIGAGSGQITEMYLGMVLLFGGLALLVGIPLGALGAMGFSGFASTVLGFDSPGLTLPLHVLALQVAVGLLVPVLAAAYPIIAGTRITAREAMSGYGMGQGSSENSRIDRLVQSVRGLSRPMLLSLRNTFRRKGRLGLTLITLTLGGAIFIAVFSVRDSTALTMDDALRYFNFDIDVSFSRQYNVEQIENEAMRVPGVVRAETLIATNARRTMSDGSDGSQFTVLGVAPDSSLIQPTLLEGRWLIEGDESAIVLNSEITKTESDVKVGDDIVVTIDGRESSWRVVGIVRGVATGPNAYADPDHLSRVMRNVGRASSVWIVTEQHDGVYQTNVAKALEDRFKTAGMRVGSYQTISSLRELIVSQFSIIVIFLLFMAVLLAVVGGLGLMGTMSLNVLERRREIGVMRAIGATDGAVRQVFLVEGVLIGLISWLVGAALALPLSKLMSDGVGMAFMQAPLSFTFSASGMLIWLVVVVVLAALASALPARSASRMSVREVLAYE